MRHCLRLGSVTEEGSARRVEAVSSGSVKATPNGTVEAASSVTMEAACSVDVLFSPDPASASRFLCLLCRASVAQRYQHVQVHLGSHIRCPSCDATYTKLTALSRHASANHKVSYKKLGLYLYKILLKNYPDTFKQGKE